MTASVSDWIGGARPRTLTSAVSPVVVGSACAFSTGSFRPGFALLALGVAVSLQVATNYANDYSDGVRGTDASRVGPTRLVASGKARPSTVRNAAVLAFLVGSLFGVALTVVSRQWWLLGVGACAIVAAWGYTGTSRPYGYRGWGETSVFVFFGLVATLGTTRSQTPDMPWWVWVAACGVGLHAVAMLLVNNIRDIDNDALAGKRTLAVRIGDASARRAFAACVWLPVAGAVAIAFARPWALLALLLLAPTLWVSLLALSGLKGRPLALVFSLEAGLGFSYAIALATGIAIG